MTFCNHCGKENKDVAKFCVSCGNKMTVPVQSPGEQGHITVPETQEGGCTCAQCGKTNKPNAKFCVQCGSSLATAAKQGQQPVFAAEDITVFSHEPYVEKANAIQQEPMAVVESSAVKEDTPVVESSAVKEDNPVVESSTVKEDNPVVESSTVKEDNPVVESVTTHEKINEEVEIQAAETTPVHEEAPIVKEIPAVVTPSLHEESPLEKETPTAGNEPVQEDMPVEKEIPAVVASLYEKIAQEKKLREAAARGEKPAVQSDISPKTYQPNYGTPYVAESAAEEKIKPVKENADSDLYIHGARPALVYHDEEELAPIPIIRTNRDAERKRRMIIFLTLGLLLLAVLGVGGYYLLQSGKDKNTSAMQTVLDKNTPVRGTDSATPGGGTLSNGDKDPASSITRIDPPTSTNRIDTTSVIAVKPDKFKYLALGQIKSDLVGKLLCEGLEYSGQGQTLSLVGFVPDQQFQKNLIENGAIKVKVSFRDNIENKSCSIEVIYRKQGNKFSFDDYAQL